MNCLFVHETKNHLSRFLRRVVAGEEIVIDVALETLASSERQQLGDISFVCAAQRSQISASQFFG